MSAPDFGPPELSLPETTTPDIKGWCPGALRPMLAGDGWLVRIRPQGGTLSPAQAEGIARAAMAHGNGIIDLSNRANLQLRGVRAQAHPALIADLANLGLIDATPAAEAARNILVTPFWLQDDGTQTLATALAAALAAAAAPESTAPEPTAPESHPAATTPLLPGKFGFALDSGAAPVLALSPADIRLERGPKGLILRPDGYALGRPTTLDTAITDALALVAWFLESGGGAPGRGRMAALIAAGACLPAGFTEPPLPPAAPPSPGLTGQGWLAALAFGQMTAAALHAIAALNRPLRLTPWRMLLIEGAAPLPVIDGLITRADNPLLRVSACIGAPGCAQGLGETRALARRLAPHLPPGQHLHISGCAKGCAHPGASAITLTALPQGYGLIHDGTARARATTILTAASLTRHPDLLSKAPHAPSL